MVFNTNDLQDPILKKKLKKEAEMLWLADELESEFADDMDIAEEDMAEEVAEESKSLVEHADMMSEVFMNATPEEQLMFIGKLLSMVSAPVESIEADIAIELE